MNQDSLLTGLRFPQVRLIASYWLRFSMRTGGGIMSLLVLLVVGLSIGAAFVTPLEALMERAPSAGHSEDEAADYINRVAQSEEVLGVVRQITGASESQITYFTRANPAILSAIFITLLIAFPFVTCLSGFNQTSGDIASRGLRYLLIRTERPNIFLGRFFGTTYFTAAATAALVILLAVYIGLKFRIYDGMAVTTWSLQGFFALLMLSLPYLALCAWMSAVIDSPFGSLAINLLLVGFPIVFIKLVDKAVRNADLEWMERLLPWGWKYDLLSDNIANRLLAYAVMLGFTLLFLFLGLRSFHKRDL